MASDIEIARSVVLRPIVDVARDAGVPEAAVYRYGPHQAKLDSGFVAGLKERPVGRLILVTAINPTPPGEGKTTTTIGLGDALNRIGKRAVVALREPSLGPVFGRKGGATGGGRAQAAPMESINLHFTGDFHAVTAAHNLLAAMVDNHLFWGNALDIDPRTITWRRVMDMNDRSLRKVVVGVGDGVNGQARETGFDITVASEVMAILCLASDIEDLQQRLARIIIGRRRSGEAVTARDLGADGAMAALLKEAILPNLVQSLEGRPILIHGGPFANIAHGCNSIIATRAAMHLGEYAVTEAGFGADLGAEKFLDIACPAGGFAPDAAVIVATLRAMKHQGGADAAAVQEPNGEALAKGMQNLARHVRNVGQFGVPAVVAINHFAGDTDAELEAVQAFCASELGVRAVVCRHWALGSEGAVALAREVVRTVETTPASYAPLYDAGLPLLDKITCVARSIYHAADVSVSPAAARDLRRFEADGWGGLPVCIAKTPYSFSADETLLGAPTGHTLPVREVRLAAGAGFVVAICGDVMTMPGLPKTPGATRIGLDAEGCITGLS
ncbi:formate--tetrahydrofolate ligase [bacterium]|nr:formate--tetrahydrofolate ligase [bacterium]